jgi:hypothetical protein
MKRKEIKRIIAKINPKIKVKFHNGDNESDILNKTIYLNFQEKWLDGEMKQHLTQVYNKYPIAKTVSPELFITLHEIGHIESVKAYETYRVGAMLSHYSKQVEKISNNTKYTLQSKSYMRLKLERLANTWACEYILNNPTVVSNLERAL